MFICSRTGLPYEDFSDGIYDDDEWLSWDWINQQIHTQDLKKHYPAANPDLAALFEELVDITKYHHELTGRYLQIWGELGELYAELKFGVKRYRPMSKGSDGRLGNDVVEIKTISPEKNNEKVDVNLAGNFNKLIIVKINEKFEFEAGIIDRKDLTKNKTTQNKNVKANWNKVQK
jgi:hypothetical protein